MSNVHLSFPVKMLGGIYLLTFYFLVVSSQITVEVLGHSVVEVGFAHMNLPLGF